MSDTPAINILLADDDKDDCFLFKKALQGLSLNTQITTVHDGEQLMQHLSKESEELPAVLFLDLNMPRKNGSECLEEIRHNEKFKSLPIIIYSTHYDEDIADRLYKNGANYFICKPTGVPLLKKTLEYALQVISKDKATQPPKEKFLIRIPNQTDLK